MHATGSVHRMTTVGAEIGGDLEEEFREYDEGYNGNKSDAVRSLLRAGLESKKNPAERESQLETNLYSAAVHLGVLAIGVVLIQPATPLFSPDGAVLSAALMVTISATMSGIVKSGLATRLRTLSPRDVVSNITFREVRR